MKDKNSYNFLIGVILGTMACLIIWYWQKSTRAEDGALDLLHRLKLAETRVRELRHSTVPQTAVSLTQVPAVQDDLTYIKGVGPVFAERLSAAGVQSVVHVSRLSVDRLAQILDIQPGRAERILAEVNVVLG
ncbi:MAG: hypothetical protein GY943_30225 [Chloroflexi bacterium]|nr:hypothetical protein [Chloroflexota bacterium]